MRNRTMRFGGVVAALCLLAGLSIAQGPLKEVDIVIGPHAAGGGANPFREDLEAWDVRVNVFRAGMASDLVRYLSGKEGGAPVVLLLCHGLMGSTRMAEGIQLFDDRFAPEDLAKQPFKKSIPPEALAKIVSLAGRTVISTGCMTGHPEMAAAFLKGGVRAYVAPLDASHGVAGEYFVKRLLYDLAWNGATLEEAVDRERRCDGESAQFRLYQAGWKRGAEVPARAPVTVRAPASIDDFSGDTPASYDYFPYFGEKNWRWAVPAPGGRGGLAYRMPFDFAEETYPWVSAYLKTPQHWEGAKGIVLDVFVRAEPGSSAESLFAFYVEGKGCRFTWDPVKVKAGWQEVRLPFDSRTWVFEKDGKKEKPGAFVPATIDPVTGYGMVLIGRGRKDSGNLFFANLRLM